MLWGSTTSPNLPQKHYFLRVGNYTRTSQRHCECTNMGQYLIIAKVGDQYRGLASASHLDCPPGYALIARK
jgi:hypothetical protein